MTENELHDIRYEIGLIVEELKKINVNLNKINEWMRL